MDELDWMKDYKKAFKFFAKIFGGIGIAFSITILTASYKNGWDYSSPLFIIALILGVGFPLILGMVFISLNIVERIINSGKTVMNFEKGYIRDLPKYCSPAIASIVYNLKTDVYKDYTATVLYLYIKKYIDMEKTEDRYKIKEGKNNDFSSLSKSENYVLDVIRSRKEFNAFNFEQIIINEAQEKKLLTDKKYSKTPKILLILVIALILLIIIYKINFVLFFIYATAAGTTILGYYLMNGIDENIKYKRTKDGKNIALLLKGLKRYMKEYTLIKDKEIDYIQILENYIPYALVLGEADTVEEFIKNNEEYRDLIYNRRTMQ